MTWECSKKLRRASLNISNQYRPVSVIVLGCWMLNSRADSKKKKKKEEKSMERKQDGQGRS